jgi:branched-chain amino acid transport system ATP-binding protein
MLSAMRRTPAGALSGGQQQMLAIGRALMAQPRLLLLDEPSMGLAPMLVDQILETIRELKRDGLTMLLVEQNARAALAIADRAYVLETGLITMNGTAAEIRFDRRVRDAYLGV